MQRIQINTLAYHRSYTPIDKTTAIEKIKEEERQTNDKKHIQAVTTSM
jgi:hypothetical protein